MSLIIQRGKQHHSESGQVAIISVMFFMILFTVIVLGFMRTVVSEQRQTQNNDLSARSMSAAEAGVEDAKRIIEYCKNRKADAACSPIFNRDSTDNCNAILNSTLMAAVNTKTVTNGSSKQAIVANSESQGYAQYYTCLIVRYYTNNYTGQASSNGASSIIPLDFIDNGSGSPAASAAYFTVSWHNLSSSVNGPVSGLNNDGNLPTASVWNGNGSNRPAVLRVELVKVPKSGFTLDSITDSARAVSLRPSANSAGGQTVSLFGNTVYNIDYWTQYKNPGTGVQAPILAVNCNNSDIYACKAMFTVQGSSLDLSANNYYLRIQSIYRDTEFRITATSGSGGELYFNGVQPSIDVTGRSSDSFKRIGSRVEFGKGGNVWWPDYALSSANPICKQMSVRAESGSDDCSY